MQVFASLLGFALLASASALPPRATNVTIAASNPNIHYHGRWDSLQGSWWETTGFKLHTKGLASLTLNLGNHSNWQVPLGVSVDYGAWQQVNVSQGANAIPLVGKKNQSTSVVRVRAEVYSNERIQVESLTLNPEASLTSYAPSKLRFQIIGDSFSTGYLIPRGADAAWPGIVAENFKAELTVTAQPGAALTDIYSYGNPRGMDYLFFTTEETDYYYSTDHNYTTPWDFSRDLTPSHVVIHIGANDNAQGVTAANFTDTYNKFFVKVRKLYPTQPIFVFSPWGWPSAEWPNAYYYDGVYQSVVDTRHALGDQNVFLVNTTGWVTYADADPSTLHPSASGHAKIAGLFTTWLQTWGLKAQTSWPSN